MLLFTSEPAQVLRPVYHVEWWDLHGVTGSMTNNKLSMLLFQIWSIVAKTQLIFNENETTSEPDPLAEIIQSTLAAAIVSGSSFPDSNVDTTQLNATGKTTIYKEINLLPAIY